ncbi:hypothetical protein ACJMK2_039627, partial [Sinanodonta woodiana]
VGRETFEGRAQSIREISSVESDIGHFLFQLMDGQITKDKRVTAAEYFSLWSSADSNKNNHISTHEVNKFLEDHLLGPSSHAERIFGEMDLTNELGLTLSFLLFDTN